MLKTLIALLLLTTCAAAEAAVDTCTGRVKMVVETVGDGLYPKGSSALMVGNCTVQTRDEKRILRACPLGSRCRVTGLEEREEGEPVMSAIIGVTRLK